MCFLWNSIKIHFSPPGKVDPGSQRVCHRQGCEVTEHTELEITVGCLSFRHLHSKNQEVVHRQPSEEESGQHQHRTAGRTEDHGGEHRGGAAERRGAFRWVSVICVRVKRSRDGSFLCALVLILLLPNPPLLFSPSVFSSSQHSTPRPATCPACRKSTEATPSIWIPVPPMPSWQLEVSFSSCSLSTYASGGSKRGKGRRRRRRRCRSGKMGCLESADTKKSCQLRLKTQDSCS